MGTFCGVHMLDWSDRRHYWVLLADKAHIGRVRVIAQSGWQVPLEGKPRQSSVMEQNGVIYLNNDSFLGDKAISLPRGGGLFFPSPLFHFLSLFAFAPKMKVVFKERQCWWNSLKSDWGRRRREASVNTYEQSFGLPVSAEEGTIKRGIEAEPLARQRGRHCFDCDFLKRLLSRVEPPNKPFRFPSFPLIPTCKSAVGPPICVLTPAHQKALQSNQQQLSPLPSIAEYIYSFKCKPHLTSKYNLWARGPGVHLKKGGEGLECENRGKLVSIYTAFPHHFQIMLNIWLKIYTYYYAMYI